MTAPVEPRIYLRHVRQLRRTGITCAPGIHAWCAQYGVDLYTFTRDGIAGEEALRIGGPFASALLDIARTEAVNGR